MIQYLRGWRIGQSITVGVRQRCQPLLVESSGATPSSPFIMRCRSGSNCSTCEVGENVHWIVDGTAAETERHEVHCRGCMPNKLRVGILLRVGLILLRGLLSWNQYSANRYHGPFFTTTLLANRDYNARTQNIMIHQSPSECTLSSGRFDIKTAQYRWMYW